MSQQEIDWEAVEQNLDRLTDEALSRFSKKILAIQEKRNRTRIPTAAQRLTK